AGLPAGPLRRSASSKPAPRLSPRFGKRKDDKSVGGRDRHILFAVLSLIGGGHGVGHAIELGGPQLLSAFGVEGAEARVIGGADEHQAARRDDRSSASRSADIPFAFRQGIVG